MELYLFYLGLANGSLYVVPLSLADPLVFRWCVGRHHEPHHDPQEVT